MGDALNVKVATNLIKTPEYAKKEKKCRTVRSMITKEIVLGADSIMKWYLETDVLPQTALSSTQ